MNLPDLIEDHLHAYLREFGRARRARWLQENQLERTETGTPLLNRIFNARLGTNSTAAIEAVLSPYHARDWPVTWMVGPSSTPSDLGQHLVRCGFAHASDWVGMVLETAHAAPPTLPQGYDSQPVKDAHALGAWCAIAREAFGLPQGQGFGRLFEQLLLGPNAPFEGWLGTLDGVPTVTGFLYRQGDVAGVYWMATALAARRRGLASAMTWTLLERAGDQARWTVLHATPMGLPLYARLGFEAHCRFGLYTWLPQAPHLTA